jgi:MoaA/NifB/PqqE/SkfB family radical SAM enzyme
MSEKKCHVPRRTAVLYLTATCNLKCKYCYIDKSPVLVDIDNILIESYKDEKYFFELFDEIFCDDKDYLTRVEFWGGEPSYGLERVYDLTRYIIENYPNIDTFMMSTNLTTQTVVDDIFNYLNVLAEYPSRNFTFEL